MKEAIKEIVSHILECSQEVIGDEVALASLGLDSLKFVNMIVALEIKFNIEILDSDLDIDKFSNVLTIIETLQKYFDVSNQKLYKCLITDCDGVLWQGISGETGADSSYSTDSTRELSKLLRWLRNNGVLLAISSKNEYKNIVSMLNPAILSLDDFAIIDLNVLDKADSVAYILSEFGFLARNAIYIDDSDAELEYIKRKWPELTLIKADYKDNFIINIENMFSNLLSVEKIDRTTKFFEQKKREIVRKKTSSSEEYNRILKTNIACELATIDDVLRIAELSQRANRFNLTGSRYTANDIECLLDNDEYVIYKLSATDKYGDMGLVAAAILHNSTIECFIMSCRVFGRGFENELLNNLMQYCDESIKGLYHPTGTNDYCKDFYLNCGVAYEVF